MAKYRINIALWQVPTMVINRHDAPEEAEYQRTLSNTVAVHSLDERMALLEKRVRKADVFFRSSPGPHDRRSVTVFAAPEYLFAQSASAHFISAKEKDHLLKALETLSKKFPHVVLFPGTVAWKKPAIRSNPLAQALFDDRGEKALAQRQLGGTDVYSTKDIKAFREARNSGEQYYLARNTCYVMHKGKLLLKYHKRVNGNETDSTSDGGNVFFVQGASDSVFAAEGLSFGLKICAEIRTELSQLVDVQVVISASSLVIDTAMQLRPGAYCCHADALHPPTVWRKTEESAIEEVTPDMLRRGGGPISRHRAGLRIKHALSVKDNPALDGNSKAYDEKVTELRGRARYYRLDYDS